MSVDNECVVCLTEYGLASIGFTAAVILLTYLMTTTPWRAIIAIVIPTATAALAIATDKLKPRDCVAGVIIFIGYISAAISYIGIYLKAGVPTAYFYYAMFMATTLAYVAAVAPIEC
jgi:hypothetical protein